MNKNLTGYPSYILDGWVLFEAMRRLGFRSDDIFAVTVRNAADADSERWWFGIVLKAQGKEFTALLEPIGDESAADATKNEWVAFAERLNAGDFPQAEMQNEWNTRFIRRVPGPTALAQALLQKGFYFPLSKN